MVLPSLVVLKGMHHHPSGQGKVQERPLVAPCCREHHPALPAACWPGPCLIT